MEWQFELLNKPLGRMTEGPVWDGEVLRFTHLPTSRILQYDPRSGDFSEWREGVNRVNGLTYDADGRLFGCSAGGRAIVRFDPDGTDTVVVDRLDGKRLNTPNDLIIDIHGRIWFSNPWSARNMDPGSEQELDHRSVVCATPQKDGSYVAKRATFDTVGPNGVLLSADQKTLYVAESGYVTGVNRQLRAYPIKEDGSLGPYDLLHTFGEDHRGVQRGIDGMCLDAEGNIVATAGWDENGPGALIYVFSPRGRVIRTHRLPTRQPTNCCFGGPYMDILYVTTITGHILAAKTDSKGWALYP
jgi:gluconolactonase